jgi:phosphate transport system substrate-binding protein
MRTRVAWVVGLVVAMSFGSGIAAIGAEVTMSGSTTVLPIAQVMAEAIAAATDGRIEVEVSGGGSSVGIAALLDGTTMIADHSRPIKGSEYKAAVANGIYPFTFHIANDAIAVVVHPANPVSDLTLDQLQQIYEGKITNWSQVGGKDAPIAIVSRDTSSGTYETWESIVMNEADVFAGAIYGTSNADVANEVSMNANAIGYVGLAYVTPQLKVLTVGGKGASLESAINHSYPIARPLFMSTNGFPSGAVLDVILFILSDDGQRVVQEIGYAPIRVLR